MDTKGKKVLVVGTGISGIAAADLLADKGVDFVLYEGNDQVKEEEIRRKSQKIKDVPIVIGKLDKSCMEEFSIAVLSPGVPTDLPMIGCLRENGVEIWGEVELAYRCAKGRLIAITGTNGKTTTTALTGELMRSLYDDVEVVGNIGIPYTSVAAKTTDQTVTVAEISSFQLETAKSFAPDISAILNITPDHLNRHHTMEAYIKAKERITRNQGPDQTCVLNYEDETLRSFGKTLNCKVVYFSSKRKLDQGLYLLDDRIYVADSEGIQELINVHDLKLLGRHNYENVMAAAALALAAGVPLEKIREVLRNFQAVEHRIEYVAEIEGVRYYNDSKGTNPDAAIQGIRAMDRPTYLIGGGYDKESEYGEWIDAFDGKVEELVLIGATRDKIAATARHHGFDKVRLCDSLEEAVSCCHDHAREGEAVLLSPACASWDMFESYEQRGCKFKELVHAYEKKRG